MTITDIIHKIEDWQHDHFSFGGRVFKKCNLKLTSVAREQLREDPAAFINDILALLKALQPFVSGCNTSEIHDLRKKIKELQQDESQKINAPLVKDLNEKIEELLKENTEKDRKIAELVAKVLAQEHDLFVFFKKDGQVVNQAEERVREI